jgi:hypothetical protein
MQTDTSYLGLRLPHPFIAGASPLGYFLDTVRRLEDAGWAAVVPGAFERAPTISPPSRAGCSPTPEMAFHPSEYRPPES